MNTWQIMATDRHSTQDGHRVHWGQAWGAEGRAPSQLAAPHLPTGLSLSAHRGTGDTCRDLLPAQGVLAPPLCSGSSSGAPALYLGVCSGLSSSVPVGTTETSRRRLVALWPQLAPSLPQATCLTHRWSPSSGSRSAACLSRDWKLKRTEKKPQIAADPRIQRQLLLILHPGLSPSGIRFLSAKTGKWVQPWRQCRLLIQSLVNGTPWGLVQDPPPQEAFPQPSWSHAARPPPHLTP